MLIKPHRRLFLTGLAAGIVAPCIVRADSLMSIDSQRNRLVIACSRRPNYDGEEPGYWMSQLNHASSYTKDDFSKWREHNRGLDYSLQRREVTEKPIWHDSYRLSFTATGYCRTHTKTGDVIEFNWDSASLKV